MAKRWIEEPWAKNPEILIEALERFYRLAIKLGKVKTPAETTLKKVMKIRGWCSMVPQGNLLKAIQDLELVYVPEGLAPGPGLLFPIRDVSGEIKRAHIRVNDEEVYGVRYISAVDRSLFIGPPWLGTDDATLAGIIQTGEVMVMEGPVDLLAIRTMEPRLPAICSLTKKLGRLHWDYLKMLGVSKVYMMFDNEAKGDAAVESAEQRHTDFEIVHVTCPAKDPAKCLESIIKTRTLQKTLSALVTAPTTILEEDD
jgi:hypothetical protein